MTGNARGIVAVLDVGCRQAADAYGWVRARPATETINKPLTVASGITKLLDRTGFLGLGRSLAMGTVC